MRNYGRHVLACILMLSAIGIGCGAKIPPEITRQVTYEGDFKTLQAQPERYTGEFLILGGRIIDIENTEAFSEISVLQLPLNGDYRPETDQASLGRFLIRSDSFLDPAVYSPGELITVAGEITGSEIRVIGAYDYVYPVIGVGRIWIWEKEAGGFFPRLHFGIGVGAVF